MSKAIGVTIYYGPLSWFNEQLPSKKNKSFLELVIERDEASRVHTHRAEGQEPATDVDSPKRPKRVVVESSDYSTLNEHVITNFAFQVRLVNPHHLYLHNPPAAVHTQMQRAFGLKDDNVVRFSYPVVVRETLVDINEKFSDRVIGQDLVKEQLLSALYPLTSADRVKPVVLMFYGPSGVGKTETAQFVNGLLGGALMRKQFSMYQNEQFASYVFGGRHNEASFARDLLDRESGVILIDEFDKANSIFHSAFYQLFDEGVFEDRNYNVELGPALIVCTSNYSSEDQIRQTLGDALYSRFDALIRYEELKPPQTQLIIDRLVDRRFKALSQAEKDQLDEPSLRTNLYRLASNGSNVRKLGKNVDEVISLMLVRSLLREGSDVPDLVQDAVSP